MRGNLTLKREHLSLLVLYIAAYLKEKNIQADVWDFSYPSNKIKTERPKQLKTKQSNYFRWGWSNEEIALWLKKNIKKYHSIIGVTSLISSNWTGVYKVIDLIKEIMPKSKVIIGGPHAAIYPEHISKHSKADFICIGEGEESFYSFLKKGGIRERLLGG